MNNDEAGDEAREQAEARERAHNSALKCKAAHDAIMDRVAQLAPRSQEGELQALAAAFEHALTVFKPKVVWE